MIKELIFNSITIITVSFIDDDGGNYSILEMHHNKYMLSHFSFDICISLFSIFRSLDFSLLYMFNAVKVSFMAIRLHSEHQDNTCDVFDIQHILSVRMLMLLL